MKKIVIAADSFKGSISSQCFADVCETAVAAIFPDCEVVKIPLGDGGEGTVDALIAAWGGKSVDVTVTDPLLRPVVARYGVSADGMTAIMEMAQASGLPLLERDERNPLLTSTYGTGQMIADALARGCHNILIGIGGSATNDGGLGMLSALGARFYDADGRRVADKGCGADLELIAAIDLSHLNPLLKDAKIIVACDVDNPLCGQRGATRVFSQQKGADQPMADRLEKGMVNYAAVVENYTGINVAALPGAGAAGGLGAAFAALLGARLMPGIDMVLDAVDFDSQIRGADLIITGEGRIDSQTVMGKTPFGVLTAAKRHAIPVVALGGSVDYSPVLNEAGFVAIFSIQPGPVTLSEALDPDTAAKNLYNTVVQVLRLLQH
ncbi:MAG: glycerate kinase [Muribaculaceae bacterium]|nr:glycerate kinase [Muribaculaceae bacterium]